MYANKARRTPMSPAALTAAVAINVAVVSAIALSAPEIGERIEQAISARNIPIEAPPPDPTPPPPKAIERKAVTTVLDPRPVTPDPIVPTGEPVNVTGVSDPGPIPSGDALPTGGTGGSGVTVDPPKPPLPVMTAAEIDPRYARDLQPEYPAAMRRAEVEGQVVVRVLVGADGRVKAFEPVSAPDDSFFTVTRRQALGRWRFKPATRDGVPYESWRTMSLKFTLED